MPFLVRKGTRVTVEIPHGAGRTHRCRCDNVFTERETTEQGNFYRFHRGGYVLVVEAIDVVELTFVGRTAGVLLRCRGYARIAGKNGFPGGRRESRTTHCGSLPLSARLPLFLLCNVFSSALSVDSFCFRLIVRESQPVPGHAFHSPVWLTQ